MSDYDVVVVGTGPAGCTAAMALAKGGASVALIDKATLPRYKTCGGGLLTRAYRLLPSSVETVVERAFHSIHLNLIDRGLHFETTRPAPLVYMTMRADLDHLLAREAEAAGAQLLQNCAVNSVRTTPDHAELDTTNGPMRARAIIAADGANSRVARAAGWRESRHLIPALEYEITVSDKDFARLGSAVRFDFGVIKHGYAWVFPKRRHLSIGILTTQPGAINLHHELERYQHLLGINEIAAIQKHGYTIPLSPRKEPLARDRTFLIGDAAGLADPITAEGISHAIRSGQLAAQAILTQSSISHSVACYQDLMETEVLCELKAARVLAAVLYRWPTLRNLSFRLNGQRLCEFMTDVVTGQKSYREAIRKPSSYLKVLG